MNKILYQYKLKDFVDDFGDGIHGTPSYDPNGDYYFINGNNLLNGPISLSENTKRISKTEYDRIKRNLTERSILVSVNGSLGNLAYYCGEKVALGKSACFINIKNCDDKEFIRYVLETKSFKNYIARVSTGSTIKNLSPTQVVEYGFLAPSKENHSQIGGFLSLLDRKIQNNARQIEILESLARTIYEYWFVQFDFPNGDGKPYKSSGGKMVWNEELKREIPEGWIVRTLNDLLLVSKDRIASNEIEDRVYVPIEAIPRNKMSFSETSDIDKAATGLCSFEEKAILFSNRRVYFHKVSISPFKGVTRDTVIIMYPKNKSNLGYAFQIVNSDHYIEYATKNSYGTEQPVLATPTALSYKYACPITGLDIIYSKKVAKIIDKVLEMEREIKVLTALRNFLIPLLVNGQVTLQ